MDSITELKNRKTGVELLKLFAIFAIMLNHVIETAGGQFHNENLPDGIHYVDIIHSTRDISILFLVILRHMGVLGNSLFFVCSAWFMLEKKDISIKQYFHYVEIIILKLIGIFMKTLKVKLNTIF